MWGSCDESILTIILGRHEEWFLHSVGVGWFLSHTALGDNITRLSSRA